uniref:Uncharacterized protein n=1 Tax=Arundo donax TaxID=35708 RepID=A0A0A9GTX0_ARUDO
MRMHRRIYIKKHKLQTAHQLCSSVCCYRNGSSKTKSTITYSHWEPHRTRIHCNYQPQVSKHRVDSYR